MGDQERPGEHEAYRSNRVAEDDTEGHRRYVRAGEGTDEPPSDEADTEGHRRYFRGAEGADEPPSDGADSEGHAARSGRATDDDEAEGHRWRIKATLDEAETETEGHAKIGRPASDDDADSEGHAVRPRG